MRIFWSVLLACFIATLAHAADESLEAGVAVVDITPSEPLRMAGYFHERLNTGSKDPLYAKALIFRQGQTRAALVCCDLIAIPEAVSSRARAIAAQKTGIPASNIGITATHSHTGPLYYGVLYEYFKKQAVTAHGSDPHEKQVYADVLVEKIVAAIEKANAKYQPVNLEFVVAQPDPPLSFNRRFHMKDGTVRFNPGQQNPEIVKAAGPIDPDAQFLLLKSGANPLAALTVFALHLDTVGGTLYSADYPGYLDRDLKKNFGPEFISIFGAGTCGDINHIDVTVKARRSAEEIGTALAATIVNETGKLQSAGKPALAVRAAKVEWPLKQVPAKDVEEAKRLLAKVGSKDLPFLRQVEITRTVYLHELGSKCHLEVQAIRLTKDTAIVTLPGEVFVDLGLEIKKTSPFRNTIIIELANDCPAYIPTKKAFAEGSYETVNSNITPGGGEAMVELAQKLLKELAAE